MTAATKLAELAPSVLMAGALREYRIALCLAVAWLLIILFTRWARISPEGTNASWVVVLLAWALQLSVETKASLTALYGLTAQRPEHAFLFHHWELGFRGASALLLILAVLVVGGLITRGAALSIRPLAALSALAAILTVYLDWAFVLILILLPF